MNVRTELTVADLPTGNLLGAVVCFRSLDLKGVISQVIDCDMGATVIYVAWSTGEVSVYTHYACWHLDVIACQDAD